MCLTIGEPHARIKRAKEDIVVWKRVIRERVREKGKKKTIYRAPYISFIWERGYHYYEDRPIKLERGFWGGYWEVNRALHCYKSKEIAMGKRTIMEIVVKMIIPKGTRYYENTSEIASEALIFPHR